MIHAQMAGRNCENKNTLLVRMGESEHHIAQLCSSSVIGERLKTSSATVCPTEADSKYLVETALVLAESLGGDSMPVLSAGMTRYATWSMSKFQVKCKSRTALPRVLENCWIQDRIESGKPKLPVNCVTERGSRRDVARNVRREQVPCRLSTMPRLTKTRWDT